MFLTLAPIQGFTKLVVFDPTWPESTRKRDTREVRNASNNRLLVSGTVTCHLRISELRIRVTFGVVDKLVSPVLLADTYSDQFVKLIHPAVRNIVPCHSPIVPIWMVDETRNAEEKSKYDFCQEEEDLILFVRQFESEPKRVRVFQQAL